MSLLLALTGAGESPPSLSANQLELADSQAAQLAAIAAITASQQEINDTQTATVAVSAPSSIVATQLELQDGQNALLTRFAFIHSAQIELPDDQTATAITASESSSGGGMPAYYLFDSKQEAKDKRAEKYPAKKKKAKKAAQETAPILYSPSLASQFVIRATEVVTLPTVDLKLQAFIAEQEMLAAQAIADALEEEELAMCLMMI